MIELTFTAAFLIYLGLSLALLFVIWLHGHARAREKKILPPEEILFVCEFCHFTYLDNPHISLHRCPRCHSLNTF